MDRTEFCAIKMWCELVVDLLAIAIVVCDVIKSWNTVSHVLVHVL